MINDAITLEDMDLEALVLEQAAQAEWEKFPMIRTPMPQPLDEVTIPPGGFDSKTPSEIMAEPFWSDKEKLKALEYAILRAQDDPEELDEILRYIDQI